MKFVVFKLTSLLLLTVFAVSCSGYQQLLKSNNSQAKFRKGVEYYDAGKYSRAISLLTSATADYTGSYTEDTVRYYLAAAHYKQGDFFTSGDMFDEFRRTFGRSAFLEEAEYMYAKGYYFLSPEANRDQTTTHQAMLAINEYLNRYPNSVKREALEENMVELKQKLYDKSLLNAKLYYKIEKYNSAIIALKNSLNDYPDTPHREELMYLILASFYEYAHNSIAKMQRQRYLDMQDAYYTFTAEYPESKYRKDAEKMQDESRKYLAKFNTETDNGSEEN